MFKDCAKYRRDIRDQSETLGSSTCLIGDLLENEIPHRRPIFNEAYRPPIRHVFLLKFPIGLR